MNIGVISLGCDKNRVDTEKMLSRLSNAGHTIVSDENNADVLIINTCAFIDSSKEESIDEIFNALELKKHNKKLHIIVTGCLSQRYLETLEKEFKKVDAFLGVNTYDEIVNVVEKISQGEKVYSNKNIDKFYSGRILTTPYHYAYLKIADGCNNFCTYCAIPSIRGKYKSEKIEDLLAEARQLSDEGVKELILVAQDVTRYGIDFDGKSHIIDLLKELEKLDFEWIRLLYLEPDMVSDELIDYIKNSKKIVKYIDVPFQHVDSIVLKRMNRHTTYESTCALVDKLKNAGIAIRSTFICGFPGETQEQFDLLKSFIKDKKLDYVGFFAYSKEEGTPASKLKDQIDDTIKDNRVKELYDLQNSILDAKNRSLIGKTVEVVYEEIDYDKQMFVGRTSTQCPDIDNVVLFTSDFEVEIGEKYKISLTGVDNLNLVGKTV